MNTQRDMAFTMVVVLAFCGSRERNRGDNGNESHQSVDLADKARNSRRMLNGRERKDPPRTKLESIMVLLKAASLKNAAMRFGEKQRYTQALEVFQVTWSSLLAFSEMIEPSLLSCGEEKNVPATVSTSGLRSKEVPKRAAKSPQHRVSWNVEEPAVANEEPAQKKRCVRNVECGHKKDHSSNAAVRAQVASAVDERVRTEAGVAAAARIDKEKMIDRAIKLDHALDRLVPSSEETLFPGPFDICLKCPEAEVRVHTPNAFFGDYILFVQKSHEEANDKFGFAAELFNKIKTVGYRFVERIVPNNVASLWKEVDDKEALGILAGKLSGQGAK